MRANNNIQKQFWALANYDSFLMQYCPNLNNKIAGIGVYILLQNIIVFISIVITYNNLFSSYTAVGWLAAIMITFGFLQWTKFSTLTHHKKSKFSLLSIIQSFINLIIVFFMSISFCSSLFESEITFQLFLYNGKFEYGLIEQLWIKPYGLYLTLLNENGGLVVLFFCIAIFLFLSFIFFSPYLLIHSTKKSLYPVIKNNYEQKFERPI